MIRGVFSQVIEGVIKRFSASGRTGETVASREYFQHYGFTSRPLAGGEVIIIREGNHIVAIASDDRRYRISLQPGEVALYDDQGQKVYLKDGGEIEVVALNTLTGSAGSSATVTAPTVTVVASTKVTLNTPLAEITGNLQVGGDITATGNVKDAGGAKSMSGMRSTYNAHKHQTNDPVPDQQM